MGVKGLWKLVEQCGNPVPVDTLENKVLAVDISIWLHQVVKGFQDNKGNTLAHAHLLGLFHRLCKLMYYRIKPVFVFDGKMPKLKKETIKKRTKNKNKILNEADRIQNLLFQNLAKEKIVQQALGSNVEELLKSPTKSKSAIVQRQSDKEDMFKLPDLPTIKETPYEEFINASSTGTTDISSGTDSSIDDNCLQNAYVHNLQAVDVTSSEFKNLPAEVRHEILSDIKETRKQSSWGRLHELPAQSDDFSTFQMKRLRKRRLVQVCLEEAEKQMEGKCLTLSELQSFLTEDGVITASTMASSSKRIASNENARYLLVKDLKKAIEMAARREHEELRSSQQSSQGTSEDKSKRNNETEEDFGDEYNEDLQKAIQMSLECSKPVYDDKDYECDQVKMNSEQRKLLKDAVDCLAKAYLIEYAGMNEDEVKEMLENTQNSLDEDENGGIHDDILTPKRFRFNDKFILKGELSTPYRNMKIPLGNQLKNQEAETKIKVDEDITVKKDIAGNSETSKPCEVELMSDSDDSDFVEVAEKLDPSPKKSSGMEQKTINKSKMEITIDLTKNLSQEEDIFADVFEKNALKICDMVAETSKKSSLVEPKVEITIDLTKKLGQEDIFTDNFEKKVLLKSSGIEIPESSNAVKSEIYKIDLTENLSKADVVVINGFEETTPTKSEIAISNQKESTEKSDEVQKNTKLTPKEILEKLKKDLDNIPKLTVTDLIGNQSESTNNEFTEISKDANIEIDLGSKKNETEKPSEVIEILDNDEDNLAVANKNNITPSKMKESLANFFKIDYVVKRTPEKPQKDSEDAEIPGTPKIKSPFFVNKTPKSGRKGDSESVTPTRKNKNISKTLFDSPKTECKTDKEDDIKPIVVDNIDPIQLAAKTLKESKSKEELEVIASNIAKEQYDLERERNRFDRMGTSITEKMNRECQQLLRLFGIPYIVAPVEAEAQCAFLDAANLTDGTITDDSDIWLFGGKTVYKNFFNQQKHVMEFRVENIEKSFNVDRNKLIQLAILCGSDYTQGIDGVGTVTALEILATFPLTPAKEGETSEIVSVLSSLRKFREWWHNGKQIGNVSNSSGRNLLRKKLKNIELHEGFPSMEVVEAYLSPHVDLSREKFTWGQPDVETIREFAKKNFGWTRLKTDEILEPVLKKLNEKKHQASIKNYFTVKSTTTVRDMKISKRLQSAIEKLSMDQQGEQDTETLDSVATSSKPKRIRKKKNTTEASSTSTESKINKKIKKPAASKARKRKSSEHNIDSDEDFECLKAIPSTSSGHSSNKIPSKPKLSKLFENSDVIPQKEKDTEEMQKRKEKAAKILKKSKETLKRGKN